MTTTTTRLAAVGPRMPGGAKYHAVRQDVPLRWVSTAAMARAVDRLIGRLPDDLAGVAGVPRSGMIPASIAAARLHLPLLELSGGGLRLLGSGSRGGSLPRGEGRLLVLDDTVYAGSAMARARKALRGADAVFAAVYARPEAARAVDLYAELLPSPHLLEWNAFNNGPFYGRAASPLYGDGIACDLDGVLCHDHASGGEPGSPYLLPRMFPCRLIATGRHERHRAATEAWLRRWGVRWERLVMLPDGEPDDHETIARFKAARYAGSRCGFFVESDPFQARRIYELARKPVICPVEEKVYPPALALMRPVREAPPVPAKDDSDYKPRTKCVCSGPGYCQQYGRPVTRQEYELCSCTCGDSTFCTPALCDRRRLRWLGAPAGKAPARRPVGPTEATPKPPAKPGPGAHLKRILQSLGLLAAAGCQCLRRADQMDAWGVAGCEANREEILAWLREEQAKRSWLDKLKAAALAVAGGLAFRVDPLDPAPGLLDEALRRTREEEVPS